VVIRGTHAGVAVLALCLGLGSCAAMAQAQEVEQLRYETLEGEDVHGQSIVVPASRAEVWRAFTTSDGVMAWAAPFARVESEVGGGWESSYDPAAQVGDPDNIRIRFLAWLPERMLAMQTVDAPPGFLHPELLPELSSVVLFDAVDGDRTRVTLYGVGYRDAPDHQELLETFRQGNAWTLGMLHRRFVEGPVDWSTLLGGGR